MSKPKISVMVPIYNASNYLRKCLNSLESQTMKEMEFILINDGSKDDSLDIMNEYRHRDARFIVLNKNNTGYGDSLNQAIKMATGEYMGIVEPDDFCNKEMFESLYKAVKTKKADIARGNYYCYSEDKEIEKKIGLKVKGMKVFEPIKDYSVFYEAPAIWSAIYKMELIRENKICFLPTDGASYQDAGFNFKTLSCAKRVVYIERPIYHYRVDNPNSSVKSSSKMMAIVNEYENVENFIKKLEYKELLEKYCQVAKFGGYHWNLLRLPRSKKKEFAKIMKKDFRRQKELGHIEKKFFPRRYWISLNLLLYMPIGFYLIVLDFYRKIK